MMNRTATDTRGPGVMPPPEESEPGHDLRKETRFSVLAVNYGLDPLVRTWGSFFGAVASTGVGYLYIRDILTNEGLKTLSVSYVSLSAALFGIVLAGLAVVATFFDPRYTEFLRRSGSLKNTLFLFWWVATLAVLSLLASVALTVTSAVDAAKAINAVAVVLATFLFVSAVIEALALVGTLMRHGIYRAEFLRADHGIQARRGDTD